MESLRIKPGHKLATMRVKGQFKGTCLCGWQSDKYPSTEEILQQYRLHAGIKEKG